MGKIRWLHISDLHYDREMMGDWPAGQNGFPVTGIDFIVFTGDMHTYGRDYNEGKRFLTELAKHYNLNPILMQVHQKFLFVRCIRRIRNVQTYFLKKIVILKK